MNKKSTEKIVKEVEKEIEKEVKSEIEGALHKKLDKNLEKKFAIDIKKEVQKRVIDRTQNFLDETKKKTYTFSKEFRKQSVVAITAAFAFLIALAWRNPIQNSVNKLLEILGLSSTEIYLEFVSAILITIIAVIVLMIISRWNQKAEEKEKSEEKKL